MMRDVSFGEGRELVYRFLEATGPVLSLDIGSGTQDVVLALPGERTEVWPRFVLPSPARRIGQRIRTCTLAGRPVWLYGKVMGEGFAEELQEQIAKGLKPCVSSEVARAFPDGEEFVQAMGVPLASSCPTGHTPIHLADYDAGFWESWLTAAGLPMPELVVAAVQDHGLHPEGKRRSRFHHWKEMLHYAKGDPSRLLFDAPPENCSRLIALQECTGGPVADTGTAAVLGAMATPEVVRRSQRQGVMVINAGNRHLTAFLVFQGHVFGVYEHHTEILTTDQLLLDLKEFGFGWLPDEQVRSKGGHGCVFMTPLPEEAEGFVPAFVFGPRRELLRGHGQFIAPYGDMMFAGCHGLLYGMSLREREDRQPYSVTTHWKRYGIL